MNRELVRTAAQFAVLTLTVAVCYVLAHMLAVLPLLVVGL